MLSRVASSLYWMARYLERAEHTARLVSVHISLELEQPAEASRGRWERVYRSLGLRTLPAHDLDPHGIRSELCFDHANRSSVVACICFARDNARQVREQISSEMWEQLNRLYHEVQHTDHYEFWSSDMDDFLLSVREGSQLFQGVTDSTISHGEPWQFIRVGRCMERAVNLINLLNTHFAHYSGDAMLRPGAGPDAADYSEWIGLLKCATAFEAYCKVYTAAITAERVAEFLLLNERFPHSLRFCADSIRSACAGISAVSPSRRAARVQRHTGRLCALLSFSQIDEIMEAGIHALLRDMEQQSFEVHKGIYQAFISYPVETALEV